jgi:hypothetical protein
MLSLWLLSVRERKRDREKRTNSILGHELRTPTNIIQCSSLLLQSTPTNSEQIEYIQCIQAGLFLVLPLLPL